MFACCLTAGDVISAFRDGRFAGGRRADGTLPKLCMPCLRGAAFLAADGSMDSPCGVGEIACVVCKYERTVWAMGFGYVYLHDWSGTDCLCPTQKIWALHGAPPYFLPMCSCCQRILISKFASPQTAIHSGNRGGKCSVCERYICRFDLGVRDESVEDEVIFVFGGVFLERKLSGSPNGLFLFFA